MSGSFPEDHILAGDADWDPAPPPENNPRKRARWPLLALLALAVIAGALAWRANAPTSDASGYIATPGVLSLAAPDQRLPGPRLQGHLLDGTAFDAGSWAGSIIVVNFWGSWCPPCLAETPDLVTVANAIHGQGVQFLGVDVRDNRASAQAFVDKYQVPYPSIFDTDNQALLAFRGLPPNAIPTTFLIDRRGRIAARALGRVNAAQLTAALATLRQEYPPPSTDPTTRQ